MAEIREILRSLGLKGTVEILKLTSEQKGGHTDLMSIDISISTLNERLLIPAKLLYQIKKRAAKRAVAMKLISYAAKVFCAKSCNRNCNIDPLLQGFCDCSFFKLVWL